MRSRDRLAALAAVLILGGAFGCASQAPTAVRTGEASFTRVVDLPAPVTTGEMSVEEALQQRRSLYEFLPTPLPIGEIGQLFWAAQGVTSADGKRAAPSAGALYPLELYALTDDLVLHYLPESHQAESRSARPWRDALERAAFGQRVVRRSPAVIVVAAVPDRTEAKYGPLAADFVQREAGHATENLLLEATARDIAAVPVGGIDAAAVAEILAIPPGTVALYVIPVGYRVDPSG